MIVLDTNVLSEPLRPSPSESVLRWLSGQDPESVFVTCISLAEVLYGIENLPSGKRRSRLYIAAQHVFDQDFSGRIIPFDVDAALIYPRIVASRDRAGRAITPRLRRAMLRISRAVG